MSWRVVGDEMALTGEAPLWDTTRQILWWIDVQGQKLLGWRSDRPPARYPLPSMPGFVVPALDGRLVIGLEDGLWAFTPETSAAERISDFLADRPELRLNDGKADRHGRLWFGSMEKTGSREHCGGFHVRHTDGTIETVREGVAVPNAIAPSLDGERVYFTDTVLGTLDVYAIDPASGAVSDRWTLAAYGGGESIDGCSLDSDGNLWLAIIGGSRIDCLGPDGSILQSVPVPVSRPTMPAFGGTDLRTLFVTSQRRFLGFDRLAAEPDAGKLIARPIETKGSMPWAVPLVRCS